MKLYLEYLISDAREVTLIRPTFYLVTKSGNTILEIDEEFKPAVKMIDDFEELYSFEFINKLKQNPLFCEYLNKRADKILKQYRKNKKVNLNNGKIISGSYIVKVNWAFSIETKRLNWKEFKKWKSA